MSEPTGPTDRSAGEEALELQPIADPDAVAEADADTADTTTADPMDDGEDDGAGGDDDASGDDR